MVTIYRVNDKEFNTFEAAKAYEEELERKEQERIEKEQQKQARLKELSDASNEYIRLAEAYEKDYGKIGTKVSEKTANKATDWNEKAKEYAQIVDDFLKFFY